MVYVISHQLKLIKMRAELVTLNDCAVPFLSHAAVKMCWYDYIYHRSLSIILPIKITLEQNEDTLIVIE